MTIPVLADCKTTEFLMNPEENNFTTLMAWDDKDHTVYKDVMDVVCRAAEGCVGKTQKATSYLLKHPDFTGIVGKLDGCESIASCADGGQFRDQRHRGLAVLHEEELLARGCAGSAPAWLRLFCQGVGW